MKCHILGLRIRNRTITHLKESYVPCLGNRSHWTTLLSGMLTSECNLASCSVVVRGSHKTEIQKLCCLQNCLSLITIVFIISKTMCVHTNSHTPYPSPHTHINTHTHSIYTKAIYSATEQKMNIHKYIWKTRVFQGTHCLLKQANTLKCNKQGWQTKNRGVILMLQRAFAGDTNKYWAVLNP